jgi:CheY-specific phosphatase CheX
MKKTLERGLAAAIDETLQTMFFIVSEPESEEGADESGRPVMEALVAFTGDMDGRLLLRIGSREAAAMASDFLGLDEPEVTASHMNQVVGELANMICGSALSRIWPEGAFRIETPVVMEPEPQTAERLFTQRVESRGGPLTAVLEVNS